MLNTKLHVRVNEGVPIIHVVLTDSQWESNLAY